MLFFDACLASEEECFIEKITLKYPTMICKSHGEEGEQK